MGGVLVAGAGLLQALPPQTSVFDQLELTEPRGFAADVAAVGVDFGWFDERLNTESAVVVDGAAFAGCGGAGCAGVEKSNKSPRAADAGAGAGAVTGFGAGAVAVGVEKAPNPLELPNDCFC